MYSEDSAGFGSAGGTMSDAQEFQLPWCVSRW